MQRIGLIVGLAALAAGFVGCGAGAAERHATPAAQHAARTTRQVAQWTAYRHVGGPLDLAGPRRDGRFVLAAAGELWLLPPSGPVTRYAPAYKVSGGLEAYIALAPPGSCFGAGAVYAIRLQGANGVTEVAVHGHVRRFATITAHGLIDGIAFDRTGRFGHRLLLTVESGPRSTVIAVSCHGVVTTITRAAPRVEGGVAIAPPSFGRFGGDLIAPDEITGRIYAIAPNGRVTLVASSRLAHGQDIGVESEAFMPAGRLRAVLVADRLTPGNRHPGDDEILRLRPAQLARAGVRPGDLLVVGEGGAQTDAIRCTASGCTVQHVADGPTEAHIEGHVGVSG